VSISNNSCSWPAGAFSLLRPYSCRSACCSRTAVDECASRSRPKRSSSNSTASAPRPSSSSRSMYARTDSRSLASPGGCCASSSTPFSSAAVSGVVMRAPYAMHQVGRAREDSVHWLAPYRAPGLHQRQQLGQLPRLQVHRGLALYRGRYPESPRLQPLVTHSKVQAFPPLLRVLCAWCIHSIRSMGSNSSAWASGIPATGCGCCCGSTRRPSAPFPCSGQTSGPPTPKSPSVAGVHSSAPRT